MIARNLRREIVIGVPRLDQSQSGLGGLPRRLNYLCVGVSSQSGGVLRDGVRVMGHGLFGDTRGCHRDRQTAASRRQPPLPEDLLPGPEADRRFRRSPGPPTLSSPRSLLSTSLAKTAPFQCCCSKPWEPHCGSGRPTYKGTQLLGEVTRGSTRLHLRWAGRMGDRLCGVRQMVVSTIGRHRRSLAD